MDVLAAVYKDRNKTDATPEQLNTLVASALSKPVPDAPKPITELPPVLLRPARARHRLMDRVVLRRPALRVAVLLLRQNLRQPGPRPARTNRPLLAPRRQPNRPRRQSHDSVRIIAANDLD
jgi:hypothetical protein